MTRISFVWAYLPVMALVAATPIPEPIFATSSLSDGTAASNGIWTPSQTSSAYGTVKLAAPDSSQQQDEDERRLERRRPCPTDAESARFLFKYKPRINKSLFYANVGAQDIVEATATKYDLDILVHMLHPEYKKFEAQCKDQGFWVHLSQAMAAASSGVVYVALANNMAGPGLNSFDPNVKWGGKQGGPSVGSQTVWEQVEWPTLIANHQVTSIYRNPLNNPTSTLTRIWPRAR